MKNKRVLKNIFFSRNQASKISLRKALALGCLVTGAAFVVTQLATNAILTPKGIQLERLNTEKNLLLEENRSLEERIAKDNSFVMIKTYSEKKFDLKEVPAKDTVYVTADSIQASNN